MTMKHKLLTVAIALVAMVGMTSAASVSHTTQGIGGAIESGDLIASLGALTVPQEDMTYSGTLEYNFDGQQGEYGEVTSLNVMADLGDEDNIDLTIQKYDDGSMVDSKTVNVGVDENQYEDETFFDGVHNYELVFEMTDGDAQDEEKPRVDRIEFEGVGDELVHHEGDAIDSRLLGQSLGGDVVVGELTGQDYFYEDGSVRYIYAKTALLNEETGDVIEETNWVKMDNRNEVDYDGDGIAEKASIISQFDGDTRGITEREVDSKDTEHTAFRGTFDRTFYDLGDYAFTVELARAESVYEYDGDGDGEYSGVGDGYWQDYSISTVDSYRYPFEVVDTEQADSPLTALQNFFNGLVQDIFDLIDGIFGNNPTDVPEPTVPPAPTQ